VSDDQKKRLIEIWQSLPAQQANQLLEFAEFLSQRHTVVAREMAEPLDIPRPENESVPKAIKRLAETYPMLNRKMLLDETGKYMTQHVMEGRPAKDVIDDLEIMFRKHYEKLLEGSL